MGIIRLLTVLKRFGDSLLLWPALFSVKQIPAQGIVFLLILLSLGGIGGALMYPQLGGLLLLIFWLQLSFSFLNHRVHQQKRDVIEGTSPESDAKLLPYDVALTSPMVLFTLFFLLMTLILLLRQATLLWGDRLFSSSTLTLLDWSVYAFDLILKAVLFDIPEIYQWDLSTINHTGVWGATLVFLSRLIILVLIIGSLLRLREVHQLVLQAVYMLNHSVAVGENRLLLTLKMYPRQIKRVLRWCRKESLPNLPYPILIEILGKTRHPLVLPLLENIFQNHSKVEMRLASLRAMEHLGQGHPALLRSLLQQPSLENLVLQKQACRTLGIWKTPESLELLKDIAKSHGVISLRLSAIESLGLTQQFTAVLFLLQLLFQEDRTKEERFAAKDAILQIGLLDEETHRQLVEMLEKSPYADNRRFAAMILGGLENREDIKIYRNCLSKETDADTQIYLLKAIGSLGNLLGRLENSNDWKVLSEPNWKILFEMIKTKALSSEKSFVRVASIQTLVDLSWLVNKQILQESDFVPDLEALSQNSESQIADAAADALLRLSQQLHHLEMNRRRESITAIGIEDLTWRPKTWEEIPPSRPRPTLPAHQKSSAVSKFSTTIRPKTPPISEIPDLVPTLPIELIGRYKIEKVLHHGQIAIVLQVQEMSNGTSQVLKYTASSDKKNRALFLRELEVLRQCQHQGIVPLVEEYIATESVAFTMPFWDALNLFQAQNALKAEKKFWSLSDFGSLMQSLCEALIYLHEKGWYHGDLKPENILYVQGKSVLIDFNSAQSFKNPSEVLAVGTPYYMAPEQVNQTSCDLRVDIYSLGVIAYELLTGSLPLGIPPLPAHQLRFDIPESIDSLLSKASHFYAKGRFASVLEFWTALQKMLR